MSVFSTAAGDIDVDEVVATLLSGVKVLEQKKGAAYVRGLLRELTQKYAESSTALSFAETYNTAAGQLGSGAFSVVKLGTHKLNGTQVAVKVVAKKNLSRDDFDGLESETSLLRDIDHPHIIKCYETFDEEVTFYIITELVAGGDLFDRIISKTQYNEKEARDLVKMFLETMAFLHQDKGIVHRDLKPENILMSSKADDADIKVADFGFAKRINELSSRESPCGTPGYVAPEIIRGDPYGSEVDIWSMGVICYVLLAGYPPFYEDPRSGTYPHKLYRDIRMGRYHFHPERWGNISPEAVDMIKKMLCLDQKERWTAQQLLAHPWISMGAEILMTKDLSQSVISLKKFRAKMQFRKMANAVMAVRRLSTANSLSTKSEDGHGSATQEESAALPVGVGLRLKSDRMGSVTEQQLEALAIHNFSDDQDDDAHHRSPHIDFM
jgi:calcium/calmodulin-dependent protein kinase I